MKTTIAALLLLVPAVAQARDGSGAAKQAAAPADLLAAYKKEFAFLEAQKRALQQRLSTTRTQAEQRVKAAGAAVEQLQARLIALRGEADQREQALREADRTLPATDEADRVAETIDRARETLAKAGIAVAAKTPEHAAEQAALLREIFGHAAQLVLRQGQVRTGRGVFFAADGSRTEGQLVRVGAVAAFGTSRGTAGALAPAGGGRLKLWHQSAGATARALAAGRSPATLSLFLFENSERDVEAKPQQTALAFVQAGGLVAWVIVGLGILAALLIVARGALLLAAALRARGLVQQVRPSVLRGDLDPALAIARHAGGPLSRVIVATVENISASRQRLEDRISEAMLQESSRLSRFSSTILVLAAVSPLLGLLGTVTGMISTFDIITEHGTGDPKLLSGGISEALITTELGLIVAIPALFIGTLLNGWGRSLESRMERAALGLVNEAATDAGPQRDGLGQDDERDQLPQAAQQPGEREQPRRPATASGVA